MQERNAPVPNTARRAAMRERLIAAARKLFSEKGYAETSTPEIVKAAEVTRGALYHHFDGKEALFRAVAEAEAQAVTKAIEAAAKVPGGEGLEAGSRAFFAAMAKPGRARILLVDGPAVLGAAAMDEIDAGGGRSALRAGLASAGTGLKEGELDALAAVMSAAFDRAALAIAEGAGSAPYEAAMAALMRAAIGPET
ncbi:TetR/AcrR family transcriptional regulator [Leisingera sp. ANG-M6]|uniref:TetR/AcrR family transcriptional regulator n=1 Tax=Leisingera sp. ANG-M6 TaxID=1577900 RepID=UPI0005802854|nr:TetR/AcrR family transcriptional regulator [Leisingera sp. ANG-M6]KIC30783.1 TetR family transcriptional regulator [Leisingera sp. ANG-M6]